MAKTGSFIKLDRGLKTNHLWLEKPFSRGQAWVDLLLLAQGVEKEKQYRGKVQHQKSGEVYTSILYLTTRWGWSRNKVYRFLELLIKEGMIAVKGWEQTEHSNGTIDRTRNGTYNGATNGTIISIENWALYQTQETNDETDNGTLNGTMKRTRNGTHNRKQYTKESNKENANRKKGSLRSDCPLDIPKRGTDAFRNKSHLLLKEDEGTTDDIPVRYREMCDNNFSVYWRYRNQ